MTTNASSRSENNDARRYHVTICAQKDIKGLLAANMADQFFTPRGVKLTVLLGNNSPKSDGAKLAQKMFGPQEYSCWFDDSQYLDSLQALPLRDVDRDHRAFSTFEEMTQRGIQVTVLEKNINHATNLEMLRRIQPDIILSARFQHIFKAEVIEIPPHGILNMHPGALPQYRGLHCDMRAMMHRESHLTMTVHEVDTGIDTGKFLNEYKFPMNPQMSLFWHRMNIQLGGLNILFQEVMRLSGMDDTRIIRKEKDYGEGGQYFTWPTMEDYQAFTDMGLKQFEDSDIEFVKGLFDKRLPNTVSLKQNPSTGMFYVATDEQKNDSLKTAEDNYNQVIPQKSRSSCYIPQREIVITQS